MNLRINSYQASILLGAAALLFTLAWGALLVLSYRSAHELEVLRRERSEAEVASASASELQGILRGFTEDLRFIDGSAVSESSLISFIEELEKLAAHAGVRYDLNTAGANKEGDRLALVLQAQGSFQNVYYFMRLLESSPRVVELQEFVLEAAKGEKGVPLWGVRLSAHINNYLPE